MKLIKETTKDDYLFWGESMCPESEAICNTLTLDDLEKLFDESHVNGLWVNGSYVLPVVWYENSVVFEIMGKEPDLELTKQIQEAGGDEAFYDRNGEAIMVLDTIEVSQEA